MASPHSCTRWTPQGAVTTEHLQRHMLFKFRRGQYWSKAYIKKRTVSWVRWLANVENMWPIYAVFDRWLSQPAEPAFTPLHDVSDSSQSMQYATRAGLVRRRVRSGRAWVETSTALFRSLPCFSNFSNNISPISWLHSFPYSLSSTALNLTQLAWYFNTAEHTNRGLDPLQLGQFLDHSLCEWSDDIWPLR